MKRTLLTAGAAAVATTAALACMSPANAVLSKYSYYASAGATQVQALGVAVQSDATAQSVIVGNASSAANQKIASAKAGTLLTAGVATTDTTATVNAAKGVTVVADAHTAGLSLLGGMIKLSAIDTTATINADGTDNPTTSMTTNLVGLTIQGKKYTAPINPNTGITIPGVVSIQLNQQQTASDADSAVIEGAGLKITLLGARNGAAAGATVEVNPITELLEPGNGEVEPGYAIGGGAWGSYVDANVGSSVQVESGKSAQLTMPAGGTSGQVQSNSTAKVTLNGVLNLGVVHSEQTGIRNDALSQATETSTVASASVLGGIIQAKALSSTSTASATPSGGSVSGSTTFVKLVIAGKTIPINVAPNTKIHVLNLGTVTINEQTPVVQDGVVHAFRTVAVDVVLDTKRAGLPVGAEVQIGFSQAQVWK
ncbi:MAG: hypothetical protein FWE71_05165 [Nocardioidaceae bacterium]|nr:hypothetical protein [Nocardioidaceae bacterium]MCL2613301.1 hypothetical protein [Nocardioidaceae bacterium]